jgi:hypothetical protein
MNDANPYHRAALLARDAVDWLGREGLSLEDAKRMVTVVINAEEFAVMKARHSFDESRFAERLGQLPDSLS